MAHSIEYRRPVPYAGRRVPVVGVGNSGAEIASELSRAGVETTIAVRSGANVVPLKMFGVPIQYVAYWVRKLPRPAPDRVVAVVRRFALRTDRVTSADQPNLYFVGHNYDATGALWNIRIDSRLVAQAISAAPHSV